MNSLSPSLRIGVLRGGPSPEYDVSLKSGAHVLKHLSDFYRPIDIFISKDGKWHMYGVEKSPEKILKHVDVIFNALHGSYGEDGTVQHLLTSHGVPYTGSKRIASALAMNKSMTKERAKEIGIKTPLHIVVRHEDRVKEKAQEIFSYLPHPMIVKPTSGGSSIGLYIVESYTDLLVALETILSAYDSALVEEYIAGREATCAVVDNFRGQQIYALPVVEIIPHQNKKLFDYHSKYSGESREICPGNFHTDEKKEMERVSSLIHSSMGLSGYSRSDFIVSPKRGIYFLEVNALPEVTSQSLVSKSLEAVGATMPEFIMHALSLALQDK